MSPQPEIPFQELAASDRGPRSQLAEHVEVATQPIQPSADHSKAAYLVLAGCLLIQAPIWGYSLAFGIFQEYYTTRGSAVLSGGSSPGTIASIGTSQTGVLYLMMPVTFTLLTKYPRLRRWFGPSASSSRQDV